MTETIFPCTICKKETMTSEGVFGYNLEDVALPYENCKHFCSTNCIKDYAIKQLSNIKIPKKRSNVKDFKEDIKIGEPFWEEPKCETCHQECFSLTKIPDEKLKNNKEIIIVKDVNNKEVPIKFEGVEFERGELKDGWFHNNKMIIERFAIKREEFGYTLTKDFKDGKCFCSISCLIKQLKNDKKEMS